MNQKERTRKPGGQAFRPVISDLLPQEKQSEEKCECQRFRSVDARQEESHRQGNTCKQGRKGSLSSLLAVPRKNPDDEERDERE